MNREKPATVVHIRDSGGIHGAERVIMTLARRIDGRFRFVLVCMRSGDGGSDPLIREATRAGADVVPVDVRGRLDAGAIGRIRKILKEKKARIVHSHDFKSNLYGFAASLNSGIRRVATAHGTTRDSVLKRVTMRFDEGVIYRWFDRIIAVSEDMRSYLEREHGATNVVVVPNGIDLPADGGSREEAETAAGIPVPEGHTVFAVVGRLYPDKGHRYFLRALSRLAAEFPRVAGLVVGDGPARDDIVRLVGEHGLGDRVFLTGSRDDIERIYRRIDCLVIPSLREGLPFVLLEAMANRVPVVATSVGDIPRLVRDGETGFLVPPSDPEALEHAMRRVLRGGDGLAAVCGRAYDQLRDRYSAETMARGVERVYASLLD